MGLEIETKPKEKRRKLTWVHGKLHSVVVETSDSSDDEDDDVYATPPLEVSESSEDEGELLAPHEEKSKSEAKDDFEDKDGEAIARW